MTPEQLALVPFFQRMAAGSRQRLAAESEVRTHAPGETILARDQVTEQFLFLIEGRWTMRRFVRGVTEPLVWSDDKPGAWASGVAALEVIAPADVFADRPCTVLAAPRTLVLALCCDDPVLAHALLGDIHRWAERLEVHTALIRARG